MSCKTSWKRNYDVTDAFFHSEQTAAESYIWIVLLRFLEVVKDLQILYKYPRNMETLITILPCPSNWRNVACPRLHRLFRSPWNPRWPMNSPSSYYRQFLGLPYSMTSLSDCVDFERTLDLENSKEKILICLKKRTAVDQIMDENARRHNEPKLEKIVRRIKC